MLKIISLLVIVLSSCNRVTGTGDVEEDTFYSFLNKYISYRRRIGCSVPLCYKTEYTKEFQTTLALPTLASVNSSSNSTCCSDCSCDDNCEKLGTCCPDKLVNFPRPGNYPLGGIYDCLLTSVKGEPYFSQVHVNMISRCNLNYKNDTIIAQCETSDASTLEQYVPVSHTKTKEAYKNRFCALCNFVPNDNMIFWKLNLKCKDGVVLINSPSSILIPLKRSKSCNMVFEPPEGYMYPPSCRTLISTCNRQVNWTEYGSFIEKACSAYTAQFLGKWKHYKNVFCYICNTDDEALSDACVKETFEKEIILHPLSFSAILEFKIATPQEDKEGVCSESAVYDHYKEKCREITCSQLTELYNKSCHWIAKSAVGLCFEIFIQVSINGSSLEKHDDRQILNYFQGVTEQCNGEIVFEMYSEVLSQVNMTVLVFHAVFTKDVEYIDTLLKLDGEKINGTDSVVQVLGEERPDTTRSRNNLSIRKYFARLDPPIFLDPCTEMFTVSKFLHCPTIQLDISDFDIVNTTEMVLKSSDRKISSKDFIRINETHISMCLQDFLTLSKKECPLK